MVSIVLEVPLYCWKVYFMENPINQNGRIGEDWGIALAIRTAPYLWSDSTSECLPAINWLAIPRFGAVLPLALDLIQSLALFVEGLGLLPPHPTHQGEIADPAWSAVSGCVFCASCWCGWGGWCGWCGWYATWGDMGTQQPTANNKQKQNGTSQANGAAQESWKQH